MIDGSYLYMPPFKTKTILSKTVIQEYCQGTKNVSGSWDRITGNPECHFVNFL